MAADERLGGFITTNRSRGSRKVLISTLGTVLGFSIAFSPSALSQEENSPATTLQPATSSAPKPRRTTAPITMLSPVQSLVRLFPTVAGATQSEREAFGVLISADGFGVTSGEALREAGWVPHQRRLLGIQGQINFSEDVRDVSVKIVDYDYLSDLILFQLVDHDQANRAHLKPALQHLYPIDVANSTLETVVVFDRRGRLAGGTYSIVGNQMRAAPRGHSGYPIQLGLFRQTASPHRDLESVGNALQQGAPLMNRQGRLVGIVGRVIRANAERPQYRVIPVRLIDIALAHMVHRSARGPAFRAHGWNSVENVVEDRKGWPQRRLRLLVADLLQMIGEDRCTEETLVTVFAQLALAAETEELRTTAERLTRFVEDHLKRRKTSRGRQLAAFGREFVRLLRLNQEEIQLDVRVGFAWSFRKEGLQRSAAALHRLLTSFLEGRKTSIMVSGISNEVGGHALIMKGLAESGRTVVLKLPSLQSTQRNRDFVKLLVETKMVLPIEFTVGTDPTRYTASLPSNVKDPNGTLFIGNDASRYLQVEQVEHLQWATAYLVRLHNGMGRVGNLRNPWEQSTRKNLREAIVQLAQIPELAQFLAANLRELPSRSEFSARRGAAYSRILRALHSMRHEAEQNHVRRRTINDLLLNHRISPGDDRPEPYTGLTQRMDPLSIERAFEIVEGARHQLPEPHRFPAELMRFMRAASRAPR